MGSSLLVNHILAFEYDVTLAGLLPFYPYVVKIVRILPLIGWQMCVEVFPYKCNAPLRACICQVCSCESSLKKNRILEIQKFGLPESLVTGHGSSFLSTQKYDNLFCLIAESH